MVVWTRALVPAVVLALVLTACAPESDPVISPTATEPAPTATTTPSEVADPATLVIPACDEIFTSADVRAQFGDEFEPIDPGDEFEETQVVPDARVSSALEDAVASQPCIWGIPQTDAVAVTVVAELEASAASQLRAELSSDDSFTIGDLDGALQAAWEEETGFGHVYSVVVLDTLLIAASDMHDDALRHFLAALRAANPGLPAAPSPSPTPSTSPSPTTPASPSPGASPGVNDEAVLPACDDLLPLSTVHALFGDAAEPLGSGGSAADHMPGPLAADTVRAATQTRVCSWGIPFSDGGFSVVAAELTDSARDRLIRSLRSASSYTARSLDGEVSFTHESESENGTLAVVYVFVGSVWITVHGTLTVRTAREFASSALDAVRSANA